jgi:UDP-N-acetyl-D-mannosaminuronic acid dehydrogenase
VNILQPGAGVGGHCIAVDPWFIVDTSPDDAKIIRTAREVNEHKPEWVVQKIKAGIADAIAAKPSKTMSEITVACLGLAFKPDIDDLRESPAVQIVETIKEMGCQLFVVEPNINVLPLKLQSDNVTLVNFDEAISESNIVLILVKHSQFIQNLNTLESLDNILDIAGLIG